MKLNTLTRLVKRQRAMIELVVLKGLHAGMDAKTRRVKSHEVNYVS